MAIEQGGTADVLTNPALAATEPKQDDMIVELVAIKGNYNVDVQIDSGDSNIEYVGRALPDSLTSSAVWAIQKIDYTTGTVITWADGDDLFDNIFDNREALSYS